MGRGKKSVRNGERGLLARFFAAVILVYTNKNTYREFSVGRFECYAPVENGLWQVGGE